MKTGGSAFPIAKAILSRDGETRKMEVNEGMSLQDYFAAKAMAALAHDILIDQHWEDVLKKQGIDPDEFPLFLAHMAYNVADAMLKEKRKGMINLRPPCGPWNPGASAPWEAGLLRKRVARNPPQCNASTVRLVVEPLACPVPTHYWVTGRAMNQLGRFGSFGTGRLTID